MVPNALSLLSYKRVYEPFSSSYVFRDCYNGLQTEPKMVL